MTREAQPLNLPRLSQAVCDTADRFYGRKGVPFVCAGRAWIFCPDAAARPGRWRARVYADLGGRDLALFLDSLLPADWEAFGLDPAALAELPTELAGAALELACRDLADALTQALGAPVRLNGLNLEEEEAWLPDEALCFTLVREDGQRVRGAMAAESALLAELAETFRSVAPPLAVDVSPLRAVCRIHLAGPELDLAELAALEPGDILLSDALVADNATGALSVTLRVLGGAFSAARLLGTRLVMEGPLMQETQETPVGTDEAAQEQAMDEGAPVAADPGALPLAISFDLGGLTLSVAEMAALAPGKILETGRDAASPVRITVAGKSIGTGSLFDVGGRIGVRIETLHMR